MNRVVAAILAVLIVAPIAWVLAARAPAAPIKPAIVVEAPPPAPDVLTAPAPILKTDLPPVVVEAPPAPKPRVRRPIIKRQLPITQADIDACQSDVVLWCAPSVIVGQASVFRCLTAPPLRPHLSNACAAVLKKHGV